MNALRPYFEGINLAHDLNLGRIEEGVRRKGGLYVVPTLIQTVSVYRALESVEKVFEALGKKEPKFWLSIKLTLLALPSLITYAARTTKDYKIYRLHDSIAKLALLSVSVSSTALVVLGQAALGGSTLAMLGIGALCHARLLPYPVRSAFDKSAFLVGSVCSLFEDCFLKRAQALLEIALNVHGIFNNEQRASLTPIDLKTPLTLDQVEISEFHLQEAESVPPIPLHYRLSEIFDQVDWTKTIIKETFEWREYHKRNPSACLTASAIQEGLLLIQKGMLKESEPKEYETLHLKLSHITAFLKGACDVKKREILIRLGLSAYGYSGAVIWEVDAIYAENITAQDPLKYALQQCRDQIFKEALDKYFVPKNAYSILQLSLLSRIERLFHDFLNPANKHNYYFYMTIVAPDFALTHSHGAKTDQMAMSDAVYEEAFKIWNWRVSRDIKASYSKQVIYDIARQNLGHNTPVIAALVNKGVFKIKR